MKYKVTLDEKQINCLVEALDLFSRIGIGQIEEIHRVLTLDFISQNDNDKDRKQELDQSAKLLLDAYKKRMFKISGNASFSIHSENVPKKYKRAHDILCVLRKCIAQANDHPAFSIWHDGPFLPIDDNLPECKVSEE